MVHVADTALVVAVFFPARRKWLRRIVHHVQVLRSAGILGRRIVFVPGTSILRRVIGRCIYQLPVGLTTQYIRPVLVFLTGLQLVNRDIMQPTGQCGVTNWTAVSRTKTNNMNMPDAIEHSVVTNIQRLSTVLGLRLRSLLCTSFSASTLFIGH